MTDTKPKMTLKLFIHKENRKVVFAEARKDFVDFLFNLMTLPLGSVTQILIKNDKVGGLGKLYDSINCLNESYFLLSNKTKESLIQPSILDTTNQLIPPLIVPDQSKLTYFGCAKHQSVAVDPRTCCTYGNSPFIGCMGMSRELKFISYKPKSSSDHGYVKDEVVYMVMDDLTVEPLTTTSIVAMLNVNGIKHTDALEQNVVYLDMEKGLKLLKAFLHSEAVLTSVFLSSSKAMTTKKKKLEHRF